jgi:hypothetical protein
MNNFSSQLEQVLAESDLSLYKACQVISTQTGEPLGTVYKRLSRWMEKTPLTWEEIEASLDCLGYEVIIQRRRS